MADELADALDEFYKGFRSTGKGRDGDSLCSSPVNVSNACAVHPNQVQEAMESAKRKGVPTDFLPDGRPVFTSRAHQKKYLKAYGFRNLDGGYGD